MSDQHEIFLAVAPGLEAALLEETRAAGFAGAELSPGGVAFRGDWAEAMRANLVLRGPARVILRIGEFRAMHLAQLDKRARRIDWAAWLRPDVPFRVEAVCRASRIYHHRAAAQRVARAIAETLGATEDAEAAVRVMVRIDDDLCTLSLDTSGAPLHRRGHKSQVGKAPMRENLAALFLRSCGYDGREPVVDPMCGSGTFVIEAAEIAAGLWPGRSREFAFQSMVPYDAAAFETLKGSATVSAPPTAPRLFGFDRDAGAISGSAANAERAGVEGWTSFARQPVSELTPPCDSPGLVIANPPYGARIGNRKALFALYGALGQTLSERFAGWRVGIITSDGGLARSTGLPFFPDAPAVAHGGLSVRLYQTAPLD
ncbi:THUMP domain-containing class I SAM-dependent RNA methyltransferase [Poseidonocella sedimentorum]|uniref:Putative N6-adenine-specific DNA methylase n=1 Tax=Poseidonocella sedimentorum TaxID=871652 RepID=A0A1I6D2L3_9RHOB|nr:RNA methyltransferase [Poseidonocella sedimentorum]SFQ99758.1 putative N6-adenine-specific DNA methylase [Poseidonocella sedimentorum]